MCAPNDMSIVLKISVSLRDLDWTCTTSSEGGIFHCA